MRGLGGCYLHEIALWLDAGSILRHGFRNQLKFPLLQSNRHGFRNQLKVSLITVNNFIILSLSLIPGNVIDYHFHLLQ